MLELDVMLTRFVDKRLSQLKESEQALFLQLLDTEDDQLWDWLSGRVVPQDSGMKELVEQIRWKHQA